MSTSTGSRQPSEAEVASLLLRQGERRPWDDDETFRSSPFEKVRRAYVRSKFPVESLGSPEQKLVEWIWSELIRTIGALDPHDRSTLDLDAVDGVVPVLSTASGRMVTIRRFGDGSSQLLVAHQFVSLALVVATLADFDVSQPTTRRIANSRHGGSIHSAPERVSDLTRAAIVRDMLIQWNCVGVLAPFRPRLRPSSLLIQIGAIAFAMAHEAGHLLIGSRDTLDPGDHAHLRTDGAIADSQWGPELAQDRLALRLLRGSWLGGGRGPWPIRELTRGWGDDQVLSAAVVSLVALHIFERGCLVNGSDSHGYAIDRLGSLMIEVDPTRANSAVRRIRRLLPVIDSCLSLEPLPTESWHTLSALIRIRVVHTNERRSDALRIVNNAKNSDAVLTARAEYDHVYEYLSSADGTSIPNARCLDLLRNRGRNALPEVLELLEIDQADAQVVLASTGGLTRHGIAQIVESSPGIELPEGEARRTFVDMWANVIAAILRGDVRASCSSTI